MNNAVGYSVEDSFNVEKSVVSAAKEHFNNGRYDMAIKLYNSLLNTNASSRLFMELGLCYYKIKEYDLAIENFTNSTNLDSTNSIAYSYVGNCYFKKLDANKAIENWITARSISPKDEYVCLNLAISYFAKNMAYESMFYYDKYLKYVQDKTDSQYKSIFKNVNERLLSANDLYHTAQNYIRRKEFSLATKTLLSAIKKYPINSEYSYTLAELYYSVKDYSNAAIFYELALRDTSIQRRNIYSRLALCYEGLNNFRLAFCYNKRLMPLVINNQLEYLNVSKKVANLKKYLDESNSNISLEMARMHYRNNEYYQALTEFENYALLNPNDAHTVELDIDHLKKILNAEQLIIQKYIKQAQELIIKGHKQSADKYLTEVISLSNPKSEEYRFAKSKLSNV